MPLYGNKHNCMWWNSPFWNLHISLFKSLTIMSIIWRKKKDDLSMMKGNFILSTNNMHISLTPSFVFPKLTLLHIHPKSSISRLRCPKDKFVIWSYNNLYTGIWPHNFYVTELNMRQLGCSWKLFDEGRKIGYILLESLEAHMITLPHC